MANSVISPGDLGLQKGLIRWWTMEQPSILPSKLPKKTPNTPSTPGTVMKREPSEPLLAPDVPTEEPDQLPDTLIQQTDDSDRQKTPEQGVKAESSDLPQLPPFPNSETLTRETLKGRLTKKIKGNNYITAKEMEELSESWRPYRSV